MDTPHLDSFEFDLNQGTLSLYFNETVDVSTLSVQNIALSNMNIAQFLTSSNTVSDNSSVVVITLSEDDLNSIKLVPICTFSYAQDCFLSFPFGTVNDMVGLGNLEFPLNQTISQFINDSTSPYLTDFAQFDLLSGSMVLTFSEVINVSSFQLQSITLQTLFFNPLSAYTLTSGDFTYDNNVTVIISLSTEDLSY